MRIVIRRFAIAEIAKTAFLCLVRCRQIQVGIANCRRRYALIQVTALKEVI